MTSHLGKKNKMELYWLIDSGNKAIGIVSTEEANELRWVDYTDPRVLRFETQAMAEEAFGNMQFADKKGIAIIEHGWL